MLGTFCVFVSLRFRATSANGSFESRRRQDAKLAAPVIMLSSSFLRRPESVFCALHFFTAEAQRTQSFFKHNALKDRNEHDESLLNRHACEGRHPPRIQSRWIPACAGMTKECGMLFGIRGRRSVQAIHPRSGFLRRVPVLFSASIRHPHPRSRNRFFSRRSPRLSRRGVRLRLSLRRG